MRYGAWWMPIDPDAARRAREAQQEAEKERAAKEKAAASPFGPHPRVTCPDCLGRRWKLIEHRAVACERCKGAGTLEGR